ncbi:MAG: hypothetical protein A2Z59_11275 [Nitrospinae bacterium RIFCSPLOWO2_02_39_17]|nr:MAG: hypothetical protein A2Z59_11275 [Nitrospinae bacterium RIFCSPLOWO2_02_39_17]
MSEQIKPFLEQRDNLTKQEFPVGNKEIKWKFAKYNPEKGEFSISVTIMDIRVETNVPIPKVKAREYYQNPDLLVASAVININSNGSRNPLKFTLQGPEGDSYARNVYSGNLVNNRIVMVNNGTVVDTDTDLMWQQGENNKMNWDSAIAYCKNLSLAGYNDWRLPNIEELKSLIDVKKNPKINKTHFPNAYSSYYWSSTADTGNSSNAWYVNFVNGNVDYYGKSWYYYVRCVRDGQ